LDWGIRMHEGLQDQILARLRQAFADAKIELSPWRGDDHWKLSIVSKAFSGRSRIERHRMIHAALGELLHEKIHALRIVARAPEEADEEVAR